MSSKFLSCPFALVCSNESEKSDSQFLRPPTVLRNLHNVLVDWDIKKGLETAVEVRTTVNQGIGLAFEISSMSSLFTFIRSQGCRQYRVSCSLHRVGHSVLFLLRNRWCCYSGLRGVFQALHGSRFHCLGFSMALTRELQDCLFPSLMVLTQRLTEQAQGAAVLCQHPLNFLEVLNF